MTKKDERQYQTITNTALSRHLVSINSLLGYTRYRNAYAIRWRAWREMRHKELIYSDRMQVINRNKNRKR